MRLFSKTEAQEQRTVERRAEVTEGVKLARKIDTLRLTLLEEQDKLEKFRSENVRIVTDEIAILDEKRQELRTKVLELSEARGRLLAPFEDIILAADRSEESMERHKEEIELRKGEIALVENDLKEDFALLDKQKARLSAEEDRILKERKTVEAQLSDALLRLKKARQDEKEILKGLDSAKKEIESLQADLAKRESTLAAAWDDLDQKKRSLELMEREITDRYETLIRTENRIKNGINAINKRP